MRQASLRAWPVPPAYFRRADPMLPVEIVPTLVGIVAAGPDYWVYSVAQTADPDAPAWLGPVPLVCSDSVGSGSDEQGSAGSEFPACPVVLTVGQDAPVSFHRAASVGLAAPALQAYSAVLTAALDASA